MLFPLAFWILTLFLSASPAHANALFLPIFNFLEFPALLIETVVVTTLLEKLAFRPRILLFVWFIVTSLTFWSGVLALAATGLWLGAAEWVARIGFWLTFMVLEVLIILAEARVIRWLGGKRFICTAERRIAPREALRVSIIGNLASIAMGAATVAIYRYAP